MAGSYREEFIEAPKREYTRNSAAEVLLDGAASARAESGEVDLAGRSPLEEFENLIPAKPSTESELAAYELADASSVTVVSRWLPVETGAIQTATTKIERRWEMLSLAYELDEGANAYEWVYRSNAMYESSGRLVEFWAALAHSAEAKDARIAQLLGTPGTTPPQIALERALMRVRLLDEAKKECPSLLAQSDQPIELSSFLNRLRTRVESWALPNGVARMPVIPEEEPDEKVLVNEILALDTYSERMCLQSKFQKFRPTISTGPLAIRFRVDRPLPAESSDLQEVLPRQQDLDDVKKVLRDVNERAAVDLQLMIRGYADKQGAAQNNQRLSLRRADWVKIQIEAASLSKIKHIKVAGYGDAYSPDSPRDDQRFRVAVVEILPLRLRK